MRQGSNIFQWLAENIDKLDASNLGRIAAYPELTARRLLPSRVTATAPPVGERR